MYYVSYKFKDAVFELCGSICTLFCSLLAPCDILHCKRWTTSFYNIELYDGHTNDAKWNQMLYMCVCVKKWKRQRKKARSMLVLLFSGNTLLYWALLSFCTYFLIVTRGECIFQRNALKAHRTLPAEYQITDTMNELVIIAEHVIVKMPDISHRLW